LAIEIHASLSLLQVIAFFIQALDFQQHGSLVKICQLFDDFLSVSMAPQVGHDGKKADIEGFLIGDGEGKADKLFLVIKGKKVSIFSVLIA